MSHYDRAPAFSIVLLFNWVVRFRKRKNMLYLFTLIDLIAIKKIFDMRKNILKKSQPIAKISGNFMLKILSIYLLRKEGV